MTVNKENEKRIKKQKLRNSEYYDMQSVFDKLYEQAKERGKFNSLLEIISCEDNILLAYRNIKKTTALKQKVQTGARLSFTKVGLRINLLNIFKTNLPITTLKACEGLKSRKKVNLIKPDR